jgi:L-galactose dehydrogenase
MCHSHKQFNLSAAFQLLLRLQVGRYGQEYFDFSAERVTASVQESLARLQIPYIDIIQCHDIEFGSLDQVGKQQCWL